MEMIDDQFEIFEFGNIRLDSNCGQPYSSNGSRCTLVQAFLACYDLQLIDSRR